MKKLFLFPLILFLMLTVVSTRVGAKELEVKMLQWDQVNDILPRYSKFTIQDIETGKKFRVQRRAGSRHADVQPLTSKDTKIMKEIYNGKWSWKRRAIIVQSSDKKIAASMHGMPHGAGALKNNFPGHFCIHFYGSTTHRTNFMDLSHKLMILKAAGKLEIYLEKADPYELTNAFFAGVKQQDPKVVSFASLQEGDWQETLMKIENANVVNRIAVLPVEDLKGQLILPVPVSVSLQLKDVGPYRYDGEITLVRFSPDEGWRVDATQFFEEIPINANE